MDVFIGWSGEASLVLAKGLRQWLPRVIQTSRPFLSSEDISKGRRWNLELSARLASTHYAILCMTPDNLTSNWIHFEAGAVAKKPGDSYVTALLMDLKASDLVDPLSQFQNATLTKDEVRALVRSVNAAMEPDRRTSVEVLDWAFEAAWSDFENIVQAARATLKQSAIPIPQKRKTEDVVEEILGLVRDLHRDRPMSGRKRPIFHSVVMPKNLPRDNWLVVEDEQGEIVQKETVPAGTDLGARLLEAAVDFTTQGWQGGPSTGRWTFIMRKNNRSVVIGIRTH